MRTKQIMLVFPLYCLLPVATGIVAGAMRVDAHVGEITYPISEITDDMLVELDLTDGLVEDWEAVMGEPTLNLLDFTRLELIPREGLTIVPRAPSDWDVRAWLGWHRGTGRLYIGAQISDDRFVGGFEGTQNERRSEYDCIGLFVDGDHSGGATRDFFKQAQSYSAVPEAPSGLHVSLEYDLADWMDQPPYAEGGGAVRGENPTVWVVEFAITPFDLMLGDDRGASVVSNLRPGMIVGFHIGINDMDNEPGDYEDFYNLFWPTDWSPDGFGDGLLLDAGGDSVVESITWARIKASLQD